MHCRLLKGLFLHCQVTAILYANPDWVLAHGGELRLWIPPGASDRHNTDASVDDHGVPDKHNNGSASVPQLDYADQARTRSASSPSSYDLGMHNGGDARFCDKPLSA